MDKKILIIIIIIAVLAFLIINISSKSDTDSKGRTIIRDANIMGYSSIDGEYTIYLGKSSESYVWDASTSGEDTVDFSEVSEEYKWDAGNIELFKRISSYDEVSVDVYYIKKNNTNTIVEYKMYNTETGRTIKNVENEDELRKKLGYYVSGSYEEELTLVLLDQNPSFGVTYESGSYGSYIYYENIFENEEGKYIRIKYTQGKGDEDKSDIFKENKKYIVKFDVTKDDYQALMTDITPVE